MNTSIDRPVTSGWRTFFLVAGLYDVILGVAFLLAGEAILEAIGMELPPHTSYIHLAAMFVLVQGFSYLVAYRDPWANQGIVMVGVAYKASYAALVFYYMAIGELPSPFFIPWAIIDLGFMIGFLLFLREAGRRRGA